MENYRPITTIARGLLGFLELKNQGKNPSDFNSLLQATFDIRDWMLQTNVLSTVGTDAAIAAVGTNTYLTVPAGELWCVHDVQANIVLQAAATIVLAPSYNMGPVGSLSFSRLLAPLREYDQAVHGTTVVIPAELNMPLFLNSGATIGIRTTALSAATTAGNVVIRYSRLPA